MGLRRHNLLDIAGKSCTCAIRNEIIDAADAESIQGLYLRDRCMLSSVLHEEALLKATDTELALELSRTVLPTSPIT